jgi:D-glycero-D-manno-heptose 1,7-bisphosphate phosphatase
MTSRAVFLDRDGVINADRSDFVKSWEEFEFLPSSLEVLAALAPEF